MDRYEIHPAARLIPEMSEEDFAALKEDIRLHGQIDPITLLDGMILDGRNRYRACHELSIDPNFHSNGVSGSPVLFVISKNLKRRNLTVSQKAAIATNAKPMLAKEASDRQRDAGKRGVEGGRGKKKTLTAKVREGFRERRERESSTQAAIMVGVSARYVDHATTLKRESPSLFKKVESGEVTLSKAVRQHKRKKLHNSLPGSLERPKGVYDVILADPPWQYDFSETDGRKVENQYPTMAVDAIANLKLPTANNAVLFLWATAPKLREAFQVIDAWGFTYKTHAVWDKQLIGMGYWFRGQHELLLVATKGKFPAPDPEDRPASVFAVRRSKHSSKPTLVYELIEKMFPNRSKLEMFARSARNGWDRWGNQA